MGSRKVRQPSARHAAATALHKAPRNAGAGWGGWGGLRWHLWVTRARPRPAPPGGPPPPCPAHATVFLERLVASPSTALGAGCGAAGNSHLELAMADQAAAGCQVCGAELGQLRSYFKRTKICEVGRRVARNASSLRTPPASHQLHIVLRRAATRLGS